MRVGGFAFIRDACRFDYPLVEAVRSVLPLCEEFVLAVGKCEDETLELAHNIDPKVRVLPTIWNENLKGQSGRVFAEETDKAFAALSKGLDWAFYIQSDEVLHEKYIPTIADALGRWQSHRQVEGFLLKYLHFYGNYQYTAAAYRWYPHEIRIVRPWPSIFSYIDAQSFRKKPNKKLCVKTIDAYIYHYGYVRQPQKMAHKINLQHSFHEEWQKDLTHFNYQEEHGYLRPFTETHPAVMHDRIKRLDWNFTPNSTRNKRSFKDTCKYVVERLTGYRLGGFKNYRRI